MRGYEIPSEALTFETVRALDYAFCRELLPHLPALSKSKRRRQFILQRGVNEALSRVLPKELAYAQPRLFASSRSTQEQADEFLFDTGALWLADRLLTQLRAGFLQGRLDSKRRVQGMQILVLTASDETLYHEHIGYAGVEWLSDRALQRGRPKEEELRRVREAMLPQMTERILSGIDDGEGLFPDADRHFHECAQVYLSRMPYRDLLSDDDRIGGRPYSEYVQALTALSTLNETRLCTSTILHSERPHLDIRNLLTGGTFADELIEAVASFLDAETGEVNHLLAHLTLSPHNSSSHLARGTPAWAPIVQTSANFCVLPCYGLDMNPFIFLATELRERYKADWFEAANAREGRWVAELLLLFPAPRWRCADGVKIKRGGKVITDIDFVAYDSTSRTVALFQLKWQQPSLGDEKIRRNNASNLVGDSNKWIAAVSEWLTAEGLTVLAQRLGIRRDELTGASLFVLGRYGAHFSGHSNANLRAAWSNRGHFERERTLHPTATVNEMFDNLVRDMTKAKDTVQPESLMLPLPGLALVINPTQQPRDMDLS
ncbi:hypothetical protein G2912_01095 [Paraburkholderia aspalathi]|uniref:Restriction endonuclease n=1 Tax=Paraburkholderia nemoris TaxID=2793076 RepID=A0ABM8QN20_9BURK|nr:MULTISPECIES: hypothetical protein [Paraburkholderia]MBK3808944.1 hypothetical protein [Paraburkholderia aspalathi]CAE6706100.1 hypothetical protein R69776_00873 [Paraburkholderia nemoris]